MKHVRTLELDRSAIRAKARASVEGDGDLRFADAAVRALNEILATQLVRELSLRYYLHSEPRLRRHDLDAFVKESLDQLLAAIERIARKIVELKGAPNFSPSMLSRSIVNYPHASDPEKLLAAEIETCQVVARHFNRLSRRLAGYDAELTRLFEDLLEETLHRGTCLRGWLVRLGVASCDVRPPLSIVKSPG